MEKMPDSQAGGAPEYSGQGKLPGLGPEDTDDRKAVCTCDINACEVVVSLGIPVVDCEMLSRFFRADDISEGAKCVCAQRFNEQHGVTSFFFKSTINAAQLGIEAIVVIAPTRLLEGQAHCQSLSQAHRGG
jgi:hypothetical protein